MAQGGMRLRRSWVGAAKVATAIAVAVLGACAEPAAKPAPPPPAPAPPPVISPPRQMSPRPPPPSPPRDACGAAPLQSLVGRPRTEIPVPVYPNRRRVVCSTCVMTQDYIASRLTIIYDTNTGLVKSVRCG
jgi:Peptidase inhibitor I78 family